MTPAFQLSLRPEFAHDATCLALIPQQGGERPVVREEDGGGVVLDPSGGTGPDKAPVPGAGGSPMEACLSPTNLVMFGGMFVVLYFFVIRPQKKQEAERQALLASVKAGDKVVTNGGIHGVIVTVNDKTIRIRVDANVEMTIDRAAVGRVDRESAAAPAST